MSELEKRAIDIDIQALVKAVAANNAVVFAGSGASAASGLPMWEKFLKESLIEAENASSEEHWRVAWSRICNGDYLTAAELLHIGVGNQLGEYIHKAFANPRGMSPVHRAIARIPFSLAITTNYDRLLESAYRKRPSTITWQNPDALFVALKHRDFMVVKTHGDVGDPASQILTNSQYRDLIYKGHKFQSCLKYTLLFRTVVFVGYSFRDRDLLRLLDEARIEFGENFGPHYALMFDHEVDDHFRRFLHDSYAIKVISLGSGECETTRAQRSKVSTPSRAMKGRMRDCEDRSGDVKPPAGSVLTELVVDALRDLSGRAAVLRSEVDVRANLDDPLFNRRQAADEILTRALHATGSFRGDVCLIVDNTEHRIERIAPYPMEFGSGEDPLSSAERENLEAKISPDSVIGSMFLKHSPSTASARDGENDDDCIYIRDVRTAKEELEEKYGLTNTEFKACHTDVRSELACPIYSDGMRVGVLNLESDLVAAYTVDHLQAAKRIADQCGWIYFEAFQRERSSAALAPYLREPHRLQAALNLDKETRDLELEIALYKLDYNEGMMTAFCTAEDRLSGDPALTYEFTSQSFASRILESRRPALVEDAQREAGESLGLLNRTGVDRFRISGPVFGTPVRVRGNTASVAVLWSRKGTSVDWEAFSRLRERVRRTMFFIASWASKTSPRDESPSDGAPERKKTAENMLERVWKSSPRHPYDVLRLLLEPEIGFTRVRLWKSVEDPDEDAVDGVKFKCVHSRSIKEASVKGKLVNEFKGKEVKSGDRYCRYTRMRFQRDPYARKQHKNMFDAVDQNSDALHKDPRLPWFVAPIVRGGELVGFLSADRQIPRVGDLGKPLRGEDGAVIADDAELDSDFFHDEFERDSVGTCFLDVISDVLASHQVV